MRYLILIILLFGCAKPDQEIIEQEFWIEPMLQVYYDEFIYLANLRNRYWDVNNLIIAFADELDSSKVGTILGHCEYDSKRTPTIRIDYDDFLTLDEGDREALLFHELGHCLMKKGHDNRINGDGNNASLMNAVLIGDYLSRKSEYIDNLFE